MPSASAALGWSKSDRDLLGGAVNGTATMQSTFYPRCSGAAAFQLGEDADPFAEFFSSSISSHFSCVTTRLEWKMLNAKLQS